MPCQICHESGHNRRTCPERETTFEFPGNPWIYPGHELDETMLNRRLLRIRRQLEDIRLQEREARRDQIRERVLARQRDAVAEAEGEAVPVRNIHIRDFFRRRVPKTDDRRELILVNLREVDYYIYWVNGNNLVMSLDDKINEVVCMENVLVSNQQVSLQVRDGYRYYLVDCKCTVSAWGEQFTDGSLKQLGHDPHVMCLDIHEGHQHHIYIDDGENLSEKNQWKFSALKLDYLLREVIKLGGMTYENLEPILDLHQDIVINQHSELDKEYAGVPSEFTNLT
jgi:hypothetical protein